MARTSKKTSSASKSKNTPKKSSNQKGDSGRGKTEKKSSSAKKSFKKAKIPVRVFNTPEIEEDKKLYPVPEIKSDTKPDAEEKSSLAEESLEVTENTLEKEVEKDEVLPEKLIKKEETAHEEANEKDEKGKKKPSFALLGFLSGSEKEGEGKKKKKSTKEKDKPKKKTTNTGGVIVSFNLYRKIAYSFIILTLLLLLGVAYFSFPSLKIAIKPNIDTINDTVSIEIHDGEGGSGLDEADFSVNGVVDRISVEESKKYQSTGARTIGREIEGEVTIINNYSREQPLVESTRLLSPGGKLYRISETVSVPAGGSVTVDIYSDDPGPEKAIGPTNFTIPGLWAGLQNDIYAESNEGFEYRVHTRRYIQQSDIDKALENIRKDLENKMKSKFGHSYMGNDKVMFRMSEDLIDTSVTNEAGEEVDEFEVEISASVDVVALKQEDLISLAQARLTSLSPESHYLLSFDTERIVYNWEKFDHEESLATIDFSFQGDISPKDASYIVNKNDLLNLSQEQLVSHLSQNPDIKEYRVSFRPSFIKKAPNLSDRIDISLE